MRKLFSALGVSLVVSLSPATAQNFAVSFNPIGLVFGIADARIEYLGMGKASVFASGAYARAESGGLKATAFGLEGGGRYYFSGVPKGPYGEAGLGFINLTLENNLGDKASGTLFYPFALVGYRFGSQIFADLGIGGVNYFGNVKLNGQTIGTFQGFSPRVQLAIGLIF